MLAVFDVFPEAVVKGKWEIGQVKRGTETGDVFTNATTVDVIEDEVFTSTANQSPNADGLQTQTLLYTRAIDLPTLDAANLVAGFLWHDTSHNSYFRISTAAIGKNQHTGEIEHVEFSLEPTEALNGE